jgi:3-oxoacyl-[acyl-carrier protein] reductase
MNKTKTFLITGNRKGIGRFLTENYLNLGYNVIGCSRSKTDLTHLNYIHFECDVSDEKNVKRVLKAGLEKFGSIDVLINNAGIASLNHCLLTPSSTVSNVFETNFNGSFYFSREVSKFMIKAGGGKIVNFSSIAVPLNLEGEMIYASSKVAVEKMTIIMSKELANFNIQINAIGPTPIETDLIRTIPKSKLEELISKQTIKRLGTFEDVLNVVDFFINPKSKMVTGQIIYLGGV